jgi:hypothetical protein
MLIGYETDHKSYRFVFLTILEGCFEGEMGNPCGEVPQEINNALNVESLQVFRHCWPYSREAGQRGIKGNETIWSHDCDSLRRVMRKRIQQKLWVVKKKEWKSGECPDFHKLIVISIQN